MDDQGGDKLVDKFVLEAKLAAARGETPPYGSAAWHEHMRVKRAAAETSLAATQELIRVQHGRAQLIFFGSIFAIVVGVAIFAAKSSHAPATAVSTSGSASSHGAEPWRDDAWADEMKAAVASRMKDPGSAQFRNVKTYHGSGSPIVCGEINAKNGYGGYGGFERFVAGGNAIFLESEVVSGGMSAVYAKVCY